MENLQQLVYKEGQARVTKASVSLVFDNRDPNDSPIGYEDFDEITVTRQVVIGGRNKYMINGQTAQLGRIRDLFHSVQLDVNNPHFLIMQGRITKVLNMKPAEILGMIQEAAGTKMYELKKSQAIKTMNKKQVKVNEINTILEEEITPQLEKLRREKTHYLQWYVCSRTMCCSVFPSDDVIRRSSKIHQFSHCILPLHFPLDFGVKSLCKYPCTKTHVLCDSTTL